ncbi:tyrosine-type recombinase/integrase [Halorubrum ezzemoulense]|uniref:tyrosine-type recombinase/integrase n=1 Tax=Halorubrum ezzemoulense TaxID=337243 RepID=UPI00232C5E83|nr:site-specific integrase [Halorubrum ezzemoulense]MDB9233342.1 site-specific integrase [Halorubrum ezzemoulense]
MTNRPDPLESIPSNTPDDDGGIPSAPEPVEFDFPLVSERSEEDLKAFGINMVDDYRDFKEEVLTWLATYGKHPEKGEGLAESTLKSTHYKLETVFRWLWKYEEKYTTDFTPEHADRFIDLLNQTDSMIDSTVLHHAKDIKRYFKYTNHVHGTNYEWEPKPELSQSNGDERDYLRRRAFKPLYQAALDYGSMKSYHTDMSSEERDRLKTYLSQRFGVPKDEIGPEDFKKANSWKVPSMIAVTLDTGLRPIEVGRAKTTWVNLEDNELNVPKDEATKNDGNWNCSLKKRTATVLERWLDERASYDKYRGRDELWLTKRGTQYGKDSCNYLLDTLIEQGDVPIPAHEDISWYSIRHGVATYWANHVGPHHAKEQLRHKSINTTMKYLHSDAETRNGAVEQIW